ncbi:DUF2200 domain-containing protein [Agrococcus jejuensis]|uniref:DUF2200 domain-containing protein n=1 Tax=Agrococcus jejuensis TaxID=399736 RepID=A0A1G8GYR8_9MICO|nr:DUF2200 domain-containing protein [Agrococcus jejuensis]SDH99507.1 hypothetical protein SAMN04489720_3131 [Agrococcus jejuensis]
MAEHRIFAMPFASVYPHYVTKVERKGRTVAELHEVITWLTGYDEAGIAAAVADDRSFRTFFADAPAMHPAAVSISGMICGIRVEEIEDPLMQQIRWMDKLVDELAKGKPMAKVLRWEVPAAS